MDCTKFMNAVQSKEHTEQVLMCMDILLSTVKLQFALMYMEDVVIFSRSVQEHLEHFETVLRLLSRAGISFENPNCFFSEGSVYYLGLVIQPGRLDKCMKATDVIRGISHLQKCLNSSCFLEFASYFDVFLPSSPRLAAMSSGKLKKDQFFLFARLRKTEIEAPEAKKINCFHIQYCYYKHWTEVMRSTLMRVKSK